LVKIFFLYLVLVRLIKANKLHASTYDKKNFQKNNIIIELNLFFRWASIGNMIQFTNAVYGTAVGNWVAGSDMLAFSRSVELTNNM
jgi:hypothetical protein